MENTQLPRFNAKWCDPEWKDVDYQFLPDADSQREAIYCNLPCGALPTLSAKLRLSGVTATRQPHGFSIYVAWRQGHPLPRHTRPTLLRTKELARGSRTTKVERSGLSAAKPALLHTRRGAICHTLRTTSPQVADLGPLAGVPPGRPRNARYGLHKPSARAPWTASMTDKLRIVLGTDLIGASALNLLSSSLALTTCANYDSGIRQWPLSATRKALTP
jgi:hypothetical protein